MKRQITLLLILTMLLAACSSTNGGGSITYTGSVNAQLSDISHDWGDISIEGGLVSHRFPFKNSGTEDLMIKTLVSSCMCTTAVVEREDGSTSPTFGMHESIEWNGGIAAGETFIVEVTFDPMAHGPDAVGAIMRNVYMLTSADNIENGEVKMTLSANVLSAEDFNNL